MSKIKIANKKTSDARQPDLHKANVSRSPSERPMNVQPMWHKTDVGRWLK